MYLTAWKTLVSWYRRRKLASCQNIAKVLARSCNRGSAFYISVTSLWSWRESRYCILESVPNMVMNGYCSSSEKDGEFLVFTHAHEHAMLQFPSDYYFLFFRSFIVSWCCHLCVPWQAKRMTLQTCTTPFLMRCSELSCLWCMLSGHHFRCTIAKWRFTIWVTQYLRDKFGTGFG